MVEELRPGHLIRALGGGRAVRVVAVEATSSAERARSLHGLGAGAARLAAEALIATSLLSAYIKGDERITLQLQASRPRAAFMGEVDSEGHVRARMVPPDAASADGDIDGILLAIKSDASKELYRGATEIRSASIERGLDEHLRTSSQVDAILRVVVRQEEDGTIAFAGGFLVERLPKDAVHPWVSEEQFAERYRWLEEADPEEVFYDILSGTLDHDRPDERIEFLEERPLVWQCRCSQKKVEETVASLGSVELREMAAEGGAEVTCHFCNETRRVPPDRLVALAEAVERSALDREYDA